MGVGDILKDVAEGLASFAPAIGQSIWEMFKSLFLVTSTSEAGVVTVTGLNVMGSFALVSLIVGLVYKLLPMAINWISRKVSARRRRRAKASA